jgi:hypothetical protein
VEDAEESEVAQVLEVPDDKVKEGQPIELRFVRFQSVNSLHVSASLAPSHSGEHITPTQIFVQSNHGGVDQTRIDSIDIFGVPCGYVD